MKNEDVLQICCNSFFQNEQIYFLTLKAYEFFMGSLEKQKPEKVWFEYIICCGEKVSETNKETKPWLFLSPVFRRKTKAGEKGKSRKRDRVAQDLWQIVASVSQI